MNFIAMSYVILKQSLNAVTWRSLGTYPASTAARVAPTTQKRTSQSTANIIQSQRESQRNQSTTAKLT